jgi:hypothetical protein
VAAVATVGHIAILAGPPCSAQSSSMLAAMTHRCTAPFVEAGTAVFCPAVGAFAADCRTTRSFASASDELKARVAACPRTAGRPGRGH